MEKTGLAKIFQELGLERIEEHELRKVAEVAAAPKQFAKNLSEDLTAYQILEAIYRADAIGSAYGRQDR